MDWSFLHGDLLLAIGLFAVSLVASMAAVAGILVLIAPDHFVRIDPRPSIAARGARAIAVRIAKNLLGVVLVAVGIVLSVPGVPGQGLLTILVGIMLIDLPRKRELELRIVSRPWVRRSVDRLRIRFGKAPLRLEPESPPAGEATGGSGSRTPPGRGVGSGLPHRIGEQRPPNRFHAGPKHRVAE